MTYPCFHSCIHSFIAFPSLNKFRVYLVASRSSQAGANIEDPKPQSVCTDLVCLGLLVRAYGDWLVGVLLEIAQRLLCSCLRKCLVFLVLVEQTALCPHGFLNYEPTPGHRFVQLEAPFLKRQTTFSFSIQALQTRPIRPNRTA